jgi:tetratricopeptide (TPR) repeat protein
LAPTEWADHDLLGQSLEGRGDRAAAIAEYKQAVMLAPKEVRARLDLAQAQEKNGNWVEALQNYHQAAVDKPAVKSGVPQWEYHVEEKYAAAKQRFQKHLAALRSEGKPDEASQLETSLNEREAAPNVDAKFHDIMQASMKAIQERHFDEAETSAKEAIATAEKIHPLDGRLPEAVGLLGNVYLWRLENKKAEETFQHQLQLTEQLYGGQSPLLSTPLQNLAMTAYGQKDFATAETIFNRMVELNVKGYGENSVGTANALRGLAHVYLAKHDYEKSEAVTLRVLKIFEATYGANDPQIAVPIAGLCQIYDQWGKTDKALACHSRLGALAQNN